jgi:GT2 family glycosyltransferase
MSARNIVVCAAYGNLSLTKMTYESFLRTSSPDTKLILINNGSKDETADWMKSIELNVGHLNTVVGGCPSRLAKVTLVHSPYNGGCGIGRNIGLRMIQELGKIGEEYEYVTLIDNDIVLTQGWDTEMMNFMDEHPLIGLCGPATNYAGTPQLLSRSDLPKKLEDIEPFATIYLNQNRGRAHGVPNGFVVIGFCMMIRRKAFEQVGLFDERFKLYGNEDNDYCIRMVRAGWKLAYYMGTYVHHWGGKSLSILGDDAIRQWDLNRKAFEEKWKK